MTTLALDRPIIDFRDFGMVAPSGYVMSWQNVLDVPYASQSASFAYSANTVLAVLASKGVKVEDSPALEDLLTNYNGLIAYLYQAPEKIGQYFGQADLVMGTLSDPDAEDSTELYLEIKTALSPEEASEKLSKINREWIFSSSDEDLMALNLTLRFS